MGEPEGVQGNFQIAGGAQVKNPPPNARDTRDAGSISGSGRSHGVGNGNPLQYSCQEMSTNRGNWWDTVHRVTKSQTMTERLSSLKSSDSRDPSDTYHTEPSSLPFKLETIHGSLCNSLLPLPLPIRPRAPGCQGLGEPGASLCPGLAQCLAYS